MKHLRKIQASKLSIINKDHTYNVGTFHSHFKRLNFKDHPRKVFKKFINRQLLTEWQAVEILCERYFMIVAVYKFNLINKSLFLLYDRQEDTLHDFSSNSSFRYKSHLAQSLEKKSTSHRTTQDTHIEITNELEEKKLYIKGHANVNNQTLQFDISFDLNAESSVFVFPMSEKHIVYTEKDFLQGKGFIKFKGEEHVFTPKHIAILDDHRGYYPMTSGYDWLATMGHITIDNQVLKFSLNLTDFYKNENKEKYSENGYFINNEFVHLKDVSFTRNENVWTIKSKDESIHLHFTKKQESTHIKKGIIKIDYIFAIGSVSGSLTLCDGRKIEIKDMFAIAEKRVTQVLNTPLR